MRRNFLKDQSLVFERLERELRNFKNLVFEKSADQANADIYLTTARAKELESTISNLKGHLYDYYARYSWIDPDIRIHESSVSIPHLNIFVVEELFELPPDGLLEVSHRFLTPEVEIGIIQFLPLMKGGSSLARGLEKENHGKGYHCHYCIGKKDRYQRTKLMFTNRLLPEGSEFYHDQHGPYQAQDYDSLGVNIKVAVWDKNLDLVNKITEWMQPQKSSNLVQNPNPNPTPSGDCAD